MTKESLQSGTIYLTISGFIFMVSGYILNIWLGKYLGPVGYGIYGVIISLMNAFTVMQTSGLPQATSKFISEDENNSDGVLWSSLVVQLASTLAISLIFYFFAHQIAEIFRDRSLTPYFRLTAWVFPAYGLFALYTGFYNGHHKFKKQAIMYIIYSIVKAVGIILLVVWLGINGAIIGFIVAPLAALVYGAVLPARAKHFSYKKLILFSVPLISYAIISTMQISIDLFFVKGILKDQAAAGLYTAAQNIARIPYYCMAAFALVVFPVVSKAIAEKSDQISDTISQFLRFTLIIIMPLTFIIIGSPHQIIRLLYSSAYLSAQHTLIILLMASSIFTLFGIFANIISGSGRPGLAAIYSLAGVVATILLCLILIPKIGITGAALATLVGSLLSLVLSFASVYYYFRVRLSWVSMLKIFFATLLLYLLSKINFGYFLLPLVYSIIFCVYFFLLYVMKEITKEDLHSLKTVLPQWVTSRFYN